MMKIVKVNCLGKRTIALAVFPFILVNKNKDLSETNLRHELIHHAQQKELLLIGFLLWYGIEWLFRMVQYRLYLDDAYHNISFEREAYANELDGGYLKKRKFWNWVKYI